MNKLKKYADYNVASFATDESFQDWVWHGLNDSHWQQVLSLYPHKNEDIEKARKLLTSIGFNESWPTGDVVEKSLAAALVNIDEKGDVKHAAPVRRMYKDKWVWASVAASIFFLVSGVWLGYQLGGDTQKSGEWMVNSRIVNGNKLTEIASAEGFKFILASNSQLSYKEDGNKKATIYLDGAAQFDFGESDRDYIINTKQVSAIASQKAKINISAFPLDSLVKISVNKGSAELKRLPQSMPLIKLIPAEKVGDKEKKIEIKPNEEVIYHKGTQTTTIQPLDPNTIPLMKLISPADKSIPERSLTFEGVSVDELLQRLTQKYHLQFEKEKSADSVTSTFTGTFNINENPFNILIVACNKLGLTYEMREGTIVLKSNSNSSK